jgi:DNA-binding GntR family transcriptional regulator
MKMVAKTIAYEHIRKKLMIGQLKPGDPVSELGLSKEMGISRSPIREAICRLQSECFIRKLEGYGAVVPALTSQEVRELFEVRAALECLAAERAAEVIRPAEIEKLLECCRTLRELAMDVRRRNLKTFDEELLHRYILADATFHITIIEASGNTLVRRIVGDIHIMSRSLVSSLEGENRPFAALSRDYLKHCRLVRPFKRHDLREASQMIRQHILGPLPEILVNHQRWLDSLARSKLAGYSSGIADRIHRLGEVG